MAYPPPRPFIGFGTSASRLTTASTAKPGDDRSRRSQERTRLRALPHPPFTVAFGTTRRVNWDATVSVEGVRYSVPHTLADTRVWVRFHGDELIVTAVGDTGPVEIARHQRLTPGNRS